MQTDLDRLYVENRGDRSDRDFPEHDAVLLMESGSSMLKMTKWLTLVCCAASLILVDRAAEQPETASLTSQAQHMVSPALAQLPEKAT